MILNNEELIKLKALIFYEEKEDDDPNQCMNCEQQLPTDCEFIDICNRYGDFWFKDGAEAMVKDLFDTIEDMKGITKQKMVVDNCVNCLRSDRTLERCILEADKELDCLSYNYRYHIRRKECIS